MVRLTQSIKSRHARAHGSFWQKRDVGKRCSFSAMKVCNLQRHYPQILHRLAKSLPRHTHPPLSCWMCACPVHARACERSFATHAHPQKEWVSHCKPSMGGTHLSPTSFFYTYVACWSARKTCDALHVMREHGYPRRRITDHLQLNSCERYAEDSTSASSTRYGHAKSRTL